MKKSGNDSMPMNSLYEHHLSVRSNYFSNGGSFPLPVTVDEPPYLTPTEEGIDDRQDTYEEIGERDKDMSYERIAKYQSSHHVKHKPVSLLH